MTKELKPASGLCLTMVSEQDIKDAYSSIWIVSGRARLGTALQRQNTEISKFRNKIFPEKEYRGLSPSFHIHVSVSDLYIPTIGMPFLLEEICRPGSI
jgi:hypothetical protein